ncbi:MAG: hypothetical protein JWP25_4442 [Bradyrhizobium sp.]|nr:hypothetical protein [Bradyrhizobium sp.]
MTPAIPPAPTAKLTEQLQIVEGQRYDFKSGLNLGGGSSMCHICRTVDRFLEHVLSAAL